MMLLGVIQVQMLSTLLSMHGLELKSQELISKMILNQWGC